MYSVSETINDLNISFVLGEMKENFSSLISIKQLNSRIDIQVKYANGPKKSLWKGDFVIA